MYCRLLNSTSAHSQPIPASGTVYRGFQAQRHRMDRHRPSPLSCGAPLLPPQCNRSPCNAHTGDPWPALHPARSARLGWRITADTDQLSFHDRIPSVPASCGSRTAWHRSRSRSPDSCKGVLERMDSRDLSLIATERLWFETGRIAGFSFGDGLSILDHVPRAPLFLVINFLPVVHHVRLPCLLALTARITSSTWA